MTNVARAEQWCAAFCEGNDLSMLTTRDGITNISSASFFPLLSSRRNWFVPSLRQRGRCPGRATGSGATVCCCRGAGRTCFFLAVFSLAANPGPSSGTGLWRSCLKWQPSCSGGGFLDAAPTVRLRKCGTRPSSENPRDRDRSAWRRDRDSNPGWACTHNGFRDRPVRPLRHLSAKGRRAGYGIVARDASHFRPLGNGRSAP